MRSAAKTHHHLERQLAGTGGKTRADPRYLRDRAGRRRRETDDAAIARPRHQRRHSLRRPPGLARDPVEPEEPAGNGDAARDQDATAATDAGRAEGHGDRDAVGSPSSLRTQGPILRDGCCWKRKTTTGEQTISAGGYGSLRSQGRRKEVSPHPSALNSRRSTLPVAVIGSVSANWTKRGYSWAASCTLTNSWISRAKASSGAKPGRSTIQALIDSVRIGSGMPTTADIATAGCFISVCSISEGPTR